MLLFDFTNDLYRNRKTAYIKKKGCANILTLFTMVIAKQTNLLKAEYG